MNKQKNFRAFVPVILNGRVVQWYYEQGELRLAIEIPMRHYPEGPLRKWVAKHITVNFDRRVRAHHPQKNSKYVSPRYAHEVFYVCDNSRIRFEDDNIPTIK